MFSDLFFVLPFFLSKILKISLFYLKNKTRNFDTHINNIEINKFFHSVFYL